MINAVKEFFSKYATFNGRTSRATFWWTILGIFILSFIISLVLQVIFGTVTVNPMAEPSEMIKSYLSNTGNIIYFIYTLALLIPSIAMGVRRLHDINKSGWWYFICLVPFVGGIILLIFYCLPAVNEGNSY